MPRLRSAQRLAGLLQAEELSPWAKDGQFSDPLSSRRPDEGSMLFRRRTWAVRLAGARRSRHAGRCVTARPSSDAKANVEDVAVLDDVILRFLSHQPMRFDFSFASQSNQIGAIHGFGADEATRQIAVNAIGRFDAQWLPGESSTSALLFHRP